MTRAEAERSERMATPADVTMAPRGWHLRTVAEERALCPVSIDHAHGRQMPVYAGHGQGMPYATGWFACEVCGTRYQPAQRLLIRPGYELAHRTHRRNGVRYVTAGIARDDYETAPAVCYRLGLVCAHVARGAQDTGYGRCAVC